MMRQCGSCLLLAAILWIGSTTGHAASLPAGASVVLVGRSIDSPALGRPLTYSIYLPPGYARDNTRYPVLYLLHGVDSNGQEWVTEGGAQATADRLLADHRVNPLILVMPDAGNS